MELGIKCRVVDQVNVKYEDLIETMESYFELGYLCEVSARINQRLFRQDVIYTITIWKEKKHERSCISQENQKVDH